MHTLEFEAIGTRWQIDYHFRGKALEIEKTTKDQIEEFDKNYSRFRADSKVAQWASKAGEYELPDDAGRLLDFYKQLYDVSRGLVTPLIGRLMEQAGYDAEYSLKAKKLAGPPKWEDAIEIKKSKLIVKQPVRLDFGAAGKGYLVDIIAHLLYLNDVDRFCINAGGDIFARGMPQTIGLEDPDDPSRVLGTVGINNESLCASAGNRRKWQDYHHIINPKTLKSVENVKASWVKAENAMLADGVATALFFVRPEKLQKIFRFEYAMIENEDLKYSKNFKAEWFT